MTLIDHFNIFQETSKSKRFSANARSLYLAILAEFNSTRFPASLKLRNVYLQDMSGITSTDSFDSARNALINAKLITHRKQVYTLTTPNLPKFQRKFAESSPKDSLGSISDSITPKPDRDRDGDAPVASVNSQEVLERWKRYNGQPYKTIGFDLIMLENRLGTEKLCELITRAGQSNKNPVLTYAYMLKFLPEPRATLPAEDWESDFDAFLEG